MTTSGLLIIVCGLILGFPSLTAWLPPDIGKAVWNGAHDYILTIVGFAVMFAKGHATVGDAAKEAPAPEQPAPIQSVLKKV